MKSIRAVHCWIHKLFEQVQNFRTDLPKLHGWEEHCSNWLSLLLSLLEWPGMTRNDHPNKLELSIRPHSGVDSAQWDWGIHYPVIIIDICVGKSWFAFVNLQSVSQIAKAKTIVSYVVFCIWMISLANIFAHWSNIAYLHAGRINTHRYT